MSTYESTFICSPEVPTEKLEEFVEKIKKIAESSGGQLVLAQQLGRKKLAYPIKKFREGSYVYMELNGSGEMIAAIEKFYQVNDPVIRYLTVKTEKKKKVPQKVAEPAAPAVTAAPVTPATPVVPASQEVKPNEHNESPASGTK